MLHQNKSDQQGEVILPLYSTFMKPHLDSSLESSAQGCGSVGGSPEVTKIIIDLEYLSCEDWLRQMRLVNLKKARLQGDLTIPEGGQPESWGWICYQGVY